MNETPFNPSESRSAGNFDADKAARLRAQAQDTFLAKNRKIVRMTWGYLLFCMILAWLCIRNFLATSDVQSWVLYGVLFVVIIEGTILVRLWYWVVNSKLAILREIKMLRMDLALQRGLMEALEDVARVESPWLHHGITKWESYAWRAAVIAVAVLIGAGIAEFSGRHVSGSGQMTSDRKVTLGMDGTAQVETTYELANTTSRSLKEFSVYSDGVIAETQLIPAAESLWTDGQNRKLAVRREPGSNGSNHRDVIQMIEPVPPGRPFRVSTAFTDAARRENGIWVVTLEQDWAYRRNYYRDTVVLPPGAQFVSAEPAPVSQEQRGGATVLRFEGERGRGSKWATAVKYRLATN
jgi:hypothetical protein